MAGVWCGLQIQSIAAGTAASTEDQAPGSGRSFLGPIKNFANRRRKILHASAGHDDRVAPAVGFFGYAQKLPPIVLAELDVEMLALDLQLSRLDNVIYSLQAGQSTATIGRNGRIFCLQIPGAGVTFATLCVKS
ncbi:MAG: hypothetical protein QOI96_1726 [Verrucomicrobiota bacterium]